MSTVQEDYRAQTVALSAASAAALLAVYIETVPDLSEQADAAQVDLFVGVGSRLLAIANRRAAALADLALPALLRPIEPDRTPLPAVQVRTPRPVVPRPLAPTPPAPRPIPRAPLGLTRPDREPERLATALAEVVTRSRDLLVEDRDRVRAQRARVERIGRAEPANAAQEAMHEGMKRLAVPGWVRVLGPNPCPRCTAWADGRIRPPSVRMKSHYGCSCIAQPVIDLEEYDRDRTESREPAAPSGQRTGGSDAATDLAG